MTRMTSTTRAAAAAIAARHRRAAGCSSPRRAPTPKEAGNGDEAGATSQVCRPEQGSNAGIAGTGWFIDLEVDFDDRGLAATGFNGLQLTGPAGHNNIPPAPGLFGTGHDDKMPGLVVLTVHDLGPLPGFSGPGTNLAGLFNLTGVTDRDADETRSCGTPGWSAPRSPAAASTPVLTVAVVDDLNHDGVYNDAPNVVTDANGDGRVDRRDLQALGVASQHRAGPLPHQRRPRVTRPPSSVSPTTPGGRMSTIDTHTVMTDSANRSRHSRSVRSPTLR